MARKELKEEKMTMNEQFLSYLWRFRCLGQNLLTETGESLAVLHPGEQNSDSGPDFFNSRIRIGGTLWAGNVEIHVKSSDWHRHGHQHDTAFDNTVLHVVYECDQMVRRNDGSELPTLVVKDKFPPQIFDRYRFMMSNMQWIPCFNQLRDKPPEALKLWAPALVVERWMTKFGQISRTWEMNQGDWEETLYQHIAYCFGFKVNSFAFELLARSVPLKIIRQNRHDRFLLEALFYGQSGLLNGSPVDKYPADLKNSHRFLLTKYNLSPMPPGLWKFLRLRPPNFPTIRISQFADLLQRTDCRFFNIVESSSVSAMMALLQTSASEYWNTHYIFDKSSLHEEKKIGQAAVKLLLINGILPFLFFFGKMKGNLMLKERALEFLEQIAAEKNAVMTRWEETGLKIDTALISQALHQLKTAYCDRRRCLECRIGKEILTS